MNYRLGPFGFPQGTEADTRGAVNLGLKDQLTGLQWLKNHISAFGGDPEKVRLFVYLSYSRVLTPLFSKVMLFGQSAGAISIADLYLNSGLENYVRGAVSRDTQTSSL